MAKAKTCLMLRSIKNVEIEIKTPRKRKSAAAQEGDSETPSKRGRKPKAKDADDEDGDTPTKSATRKGKGKTAKFALKANNESPEAHAEDEKKETLTKLAHAAMGKAAKSSPAVKDESSQELTSVKNKGSDAVVKDDGSEEEAI